MPLPTIAGLQRLWGAGNQYSLAESMPRYHVATPAALVADSIYVYRVRFPRKMKVTSMSWYIGAAAGNVDAGLYSSVDGGTTLTRMSSTGTTLAAGTNAVQTAALTAAQDVRPEVDYWLAIQVSTATTLTLGRFGAVAGIMFNGFYSAILATTFGLPTSISGHSQTSNIVWVQAS